MSTTNCDFNTVSLNHLYISVTTPTTAPITAPSILNASPTTLPTSMMVFSSQSNPPPSSFVVDHKSDTAFQSSPNGCMRPSTASNNPPNANSNPATTLFTMPNKKLNASSTTSITPLKSSNFMLTPSRDLPIFSTIGPKINFRPRLIFSNSADTTASTGGKAFWKISTIGRIPLSNACNAGTSTALAMSATSPTALINRSKNPLLANMPVKVLLRPDNTSFILFIFSLNLSVLAAAFFCSSVPSLSALAFIC